MTEEELKARERELALQAAELDLESKRFALKRQHEAAWTDARTQRRDQTMTTYARLGCFVGGLGLVGAGVADALFNPFAFIEAPKLIAAGTGLMVVGATGRKKAGND